MDSWERFNEISLPDKKAFYSELFLEDITDEEYTHSEKVFKELKLKNIGNYLTYMFKAIYYYLQMCLKTLETGVLKYMNLILLILYNYGISMASLFKKDRNNIKIIN